MGVAVSQGARWLTRCPFRENILRTLRKRPRAAYFEAMYGDIIGISVYATIEPIMMRHFGSIAGDSGSSSKYSKARRVV